MPPTKDQDLLARNRAAFTARKPYEQLWDEVAERMCPEMAGFGSDAEKRMEASLYDKARDSSPMLALTRLQSVLYQGLTPRDYRWHGLGIIEDPDLEEYQPVKVWLERYAKILFTRRYDPRAGFDAMLPNLYRTGGLFGTAPILQESGGRGLPMRYRALDLRETALETDAWQKITALHRRFRLTARQIEGAYPGADLPSWLRTAIKGNGSERFEIRHSIVPRPDGEEGARATRRMPFRSCHMLADGHVLRDSGYQRLRAYGFFWERYAGWPYGVGPGARVLADVKELFTYVITTTRMGMKQTDPPTMWSDDVDVDSLDLNPGAHNQGMMDFAGRALFQTLAVQGNPVLGLEMQDRKVRQIQEAFHNAAFSLLEPNDREMTATEVLERVRQNRSMVSPVVGGAETYWLNEQIDNELHALSQERQPNGEPLLPPPPRELEGLSIRATYKSPLTQATQADEASSTVNYLRLCAELAPEEAAKLVDRKEALRVIAKGMSVPAHVLRSRAAVARIEEGEMQEAEQMRQMAQVQMAAEAMGQASPMVNALANNRAVSS